MITYPTEVAPNWYDASPCIVCGNEVDWVGGWFSGTVTCTPTTPEQILKHALHEERVTYEQAYDTHGVPTGDRGRWHPVVYGWQMRELPDGTHEVYEMVTMMFLDLAGNYWGYQANDGMGRVYAWAEQARVRD